MTESAKEPCTISDSALLLIAPPILFFILSDLLFLFTGWHGVGDASVATDIAQARGDATARLYILAAVLAVAGASFFSLLSVGVDLKRLFGPVGRMRLGAAMIAGIAIAALYFGTLGSRVPIQHYIGDTLLKTATERYEQLEYCVPRAAPSPTPTATAKPASGAAAAPKPKPAAATAPTVAATPAADAAGAAKPGTSPAPTPSPTPLVCESDAVGRYAASPLYSRFSAMMTAMRALLILAGFALIGGAISCLAEPVGKVSQEERARFLAGQRRRLARYINLAALLMVCGMAFLIAWMRWPVVLMAAEPAKTYLIHVNALGIFFGVTYSIMIASYAAPVAATLRARVAAYQRDKDGTTDESDLFDKTMLATLGKILVVLAPALASLVPPVIDVLAGII